MKIILKRILLSSFLIFSLLYMCACNNTAELEVKYKSQINKLQNEISDLQNEIEDLDNKVDEAYADGYSKGYAKGEADQKSKSQSSQKTSSTSSSASTSTQTSTNTKSYNYVLNTSSKKFHYSSCGSVKQIKAKNTDYFTGTREAIIALGYSPCGKCKP